MNIIKPWNENVWFSPCYVINEWAKQASLGNSRIKKYEEAWVCAVALICHSKIVPAEWWIQVPKIDPPDVMGMNIVITDDGMSQNIQEVPLEIFEIRDYQKESLEESIIRKLGKKDYTGMMLVGFVRRQGVYDMKVVSENIKKIYPKALMICLIIIEDPTVKTNITFTQVFPELVMFRQDFGNYCRNIAQNDFLVMRRSTKIVNGDTSTTTDTYTLIP